MKTNRFLRTVGIVATSALTVAGLSTVAMAPAGLLVTEAMANEVLSLPMFPELTDAAVDYFIEKLNEWPAPFE